MAEERRLVTILFADIVNSTRLTTSQEPEVIRETLRHVFEDIRRRIEAHGGMVEKFIGDEVMAVFGVPTAHDDDADRAVRAAFAISAGVPAPMALRIGVNTGEVVAAAGGDQLLVTGEPVIAAARLRQAADAGQILVGAPTERLTRSTVVYGRKRMVKAKGLGVLAAYPGERLLDVMPEVRRGVPGLRAPLIGRDDELRLLKDAYQRCARETRPYLVTIFGSAGAGKSRLVREFATTLGEGLVLRGRCLPYGEGITFWPLREMLLSAAGIDAADERETAITKMGAAISRAISDADDAESVRRALSTVVALEPIENAQTAGDATTLRWAVRRYLEALTAVGPLTLVFEDIHWAEPTLLDLIDSVATSARAPIFVVCLARPELLERRPTWGAGRRNAAAIDLNPLSERDTRALISALLHVEALPEGTREDLVRRAGGNPLYLEEFLRMLIDSGRIARRGRRWSVIADTGAGPVAVPETITGIISARLDLLPAVARRVLRVGSSIGRVFWTDQLEALGISVAEAEGAIAELVARDLVIEIDERGIAGGRGVKFSHVLVRDVAYAGIHKLERLRLHERLGRWLEVTAAERRDEYADILAYHAEQAFLLARELGTPDGTTLGAWALGHLQTAIAGARARWDRPAVLGLCARAVTVGEASGAPTGVLAEVQAIGALTRHFVASTPETLRGLEAAMGPLSDAPPSPVLVRVLVNLARGAAASGRVDRAVQLFAEARRVADATGDPSAIDEALQGSATIGWMVGDEEERERWLRAAVDHRRAHGSREVATGTPFQPLASLAAQAGRLSEAIELSEEDLTLWSQHTPITGRRKAIENRAAQAGWAGDNARSVELREQALPVAREFGDSEAIKTALYFAGAARLSAGDASAALPPLEESLAVDERNEDRGQIPETLWRLSRAYLGVGDLDRARAHAERAVAEVLAHDRFSQASTRAQLAEVRAAEGRVDEANGLFLEALERLRPLRYQATVAEIRVRFALFLIGQRGFDEARSQLELAHAFWSDPAAWRHREEIEGLLSQCPASAV